MVTGRQRYEPQSATDIEREFSDWHAWIGVNRLRYAQRNRTSPPVTVKGEDWLDVRDQIIKWKRQHGEIT